ncbi:hypothetical protein E2C01_016211 [Portunus trituberculatus]|uniref:Uncharacterized protein n=1 Tax=Portunus trituberculatus TaxID=210409 RepID=A0A5B7DQD0_PORTR|nr:hypothetical protein [Portunus trituberculatus]
MAATTSVVINICLRTVRQGPEAMQYLTSCPPTQPAALVLFIYHTPHCHAAGKTPLHIKLDSNLPGTPAHPLNTWNV